MPMEETLTALISIVILDLVLAGDNALVIGLVASYLPAQQQKKVIIWGSICAVIIRSLATFAIVWLLQVPGLLTIGGCILLYISYKLLNYNQRRTLKVTTTPQLWPAVKTIITADMMMGLDNVLAMAGAAQGNIILVIIGLLISVPIVIGGSTICARLIHQFHSLIYLGSVVLVFTAIKMITTEPYLSILFVNHATLKYGITLLVIFIIFAIHFFHSKT